MSYLRITEGSKKGKLVKAPAASSVRPTGSRTRQALFNVLRGKIQSSHFLDVCAGSGVMGLEALSRGAAQLTAIEENRQAYNILSNNVEKLGLKAKIIRGNCVSVLSKLDAHSFDLIFADPPYQSRLAEAIIESVANYELLADDGWLVVEHYRKRKPLQQSPELVLFDERHYGQTTLSFYKRS
jgi:16S rRNA (guanine966-N2)-methyltransferase